MTGAPGMNNIPELVTRAATIFRWENEITAAVLTGITNATSESLYRLARASAIWAGPS